MVQWGTLKSRHTIYETPSIWSWFHNKTTILNKNYTVLWLNSQTRQLNILF